MSSNFLVTLPSYNLGSLGDQAIVNQIKKHYIDCQIPYNPNKLLGLVCHFDKLMCICCDCLACYHVPFNTISRFIEQNKPVHLVNTSWGTDINPVNERFIKRICNYDKLYVYCRDKISLDLISAYNFKNKPTLCADIAFTHQSDDTILSHHTNNWLKLCDKPVVGVNVHQLYGAQNNTVTHHFVQFIKKIMTNYRVMLICHDSRGGESHHLNHIMKLCGDDHINLYVCNPTTPGQVQAICKKLHTVVTCRMHLAILSLSVNTPVIAINYNGVKTSGMMNLFDLDRYCLSSNETSNLFQTFEHLNVNRTTVVDIIKQTLYNIKQLAYKQLQIL